MLRITRLLVEMQGSRPIRRGRPRVPVVIWNLTRRCNLHCKHCYAVATATPDPEELTTEEAMAVVADLVRMRVPALILSGGEPLLRPDLPEIVAAARAGGLFVALSTNGTVIDAERATWIAEAGFGYVGISLDGLAERHDRFRGARGAFAASLAAARRLEALGVKVGLRFTLTEATAPDLEPLLALTEREGFTKFYLSHLNYGGRGNLHRTLSPWAERSRRAVELLIEAAWRSLERGQPIEFVTGNNDADGVLLYAWVQRHLPRFAPRLLELLEAWGGNAAGEGVANIDWRGDVHPDTYWAHHTLGNVRERPFSEIWTRSDDPLLAGLRRHPRPVRGRCGACRWLRICNGNTRVRAERLSGDPWAPDPGCHLTDAEIGVAGVDERPRLRPFRPREDAVDAAYVELLRR